MDAVNDVRLTTDTAVSPRHHEVELLAFTFWQDRGAPIGTPEVDWFRAEAELKVESSAGDTVLLAIAKKIGATLGTVTALVTTDY